MQHLVVIMVSSRRLAHFQRKAVNCGQYWLDTAPEKKMTLTFLRLSILCFSISSFLIKHFPDSLQHLLLPTSQYIWILDSISSTNTCIKKYYINFHVTLNSNHKWSLSQHNHLLSPLCPAQEKTRHLEKTSCTQKNLFHPSLSTHKITKIRIIIMHGEMTHTRVKHYTKKFYLLHISNITIVIAFTFTSFVDSWLIHY